MIEPNHSSSRLEGMQAAVPTALRQVEVSAVADVTTRTFEAFYAKSYNDLVRALSLTLGDQGLGREAADEAMTRAFSKWNQVADYDNPAGWTYRVGLNWARSLHRKLARKMPWHEVPKELPSTPDPQLEHALSSLDIKYRSVVVCRYLLDWSTEETASALQIAPGTVKSRLSTGLTRLRTALETDHDS